MVIAWLIATLGLASKGEAVSFDVDGQKRSAIVFKPSTNGQSKPAIYFVFHGLGGNAAEAVRQFHIHELDPSAYVVYAQGEPPPAGSDRPNRAGRILTNKNMWQVMPSQFDNRDIHFVQALLKWGDNAGADSAHRYYIGHSNGSAFAWVVLKEIGNEFTRFVGMNGGTLMSLQGAPKKSALLMTGTSDRIVPDSSVQRFADTLAAHNDCSAGSGSPVKTFPGAHPVHLYEYNGGHMPPKDAYEMAVRFCQTGKP